MLAMSEHLGVEILRGALPDAFPEKPTGVLSVEGGELFVGDLNKLAEFDDHSRIRAVALTWNWENEIGYPGTSGSEQGLKPFGKELIAEMGAAFLCAYSGIEQMTIRNSAAYIQNWLEHLKNDKKLVIQAAQKAQKAVDYIYNPAKNLEAAA